MIFKRALHAGLSLFNTLFALHALYNNNIDWFIIFAFIASILLTLTLKENNYEA